MTYEQPKVTLTEAQWAYLKEQEDIKTAASLEYAKHQTEAFNATTATMNLQTETMRNQENNFMAEKRDWFAGQALTALISKAPFFDRDGEFGKPVDMIQFKLDMAESAYGYADAMMKVRSVSE